MSKVNKIKFCWECGKKLWNTSVFVKMVVYGHERVLHKACAEEIKRMDAANIVDIGEDL